VRRLAAVVGQPPEQRRGVDVLVEMLEPDLSRPSSSKRPSYPGTASTWEAVSFVTFGM
jgi:hypothetical protein